MGEDNTEVDYYVKEKRIGPKEIEYDGFLSDSKGKVLYENRGNRIIFSGVAQSDSSAPTTVNAAENVIRAICKSEGLSWQTPDFFDEYEFYDLSTPDGYPNRKTDFYKLLRFPDVELDKLVVTYKDGRLHVDRWLPMDLSIEKNKKLISSSD